MSFSSLPIDLRPYKRWAVLSIDTVYDPPTDAILITGSINPSSGSSRGTANLVGTDGISAAINFGWGPTEIFPMQVKEFLSSGSSGISPIGLWKD